MHKIDTLGGVVRLHMIRPFLCQPDPALLPQHLPPLLPPPPQRDPTRVPEAEEGADAAQQAAAAEA
jgi:hypothetical protein